MELKKEHLSPDVQELNKDIWNEQEPQGSHLEETFLLIWKQIPNNFPLEREVKFHPTRRWRFDFANHDIMLAIEIEGGVWSQGRHTRGSGYIEDCLKYNEATMAGWKVLRLPSHLIRPAYLEDICDKFGPLYQRDQYDD